eukprot:g10032.t1
MPSWSAEAWRCLLLAGWDGEMLPLAALPGESECSASQLLRGAREVKPMMAAPLPLAESLQGVAALHLSGTRLWAWMNSGTLQAGGEPWPRLRAGGSRCAGAGHAGRRSELKLRLAAGRCRDAATAARSAAALRGEAAAFDEAPEEAVEVLRRRVLELETALQLATLRGAESDRSSGYLVVRELALARSQKEPNLPVLSDASRSLRDGRAPPQQVLAELEKVWLPSDQALLEARVWRARGRHRRLFMELRETERWSGSQRWSGELQAEELLKHCEHSRRFDASRLELLRTLAAHEDAGALRSRRSRRSYGALTLTPKISHPAAQRRICLLQLLMPFALILNDGPKRPDDVTVSIHDWKSLSQSEIIVRHLYVILQWGSTAVWARRMVGYCACFAVCVAPPADLFLYRQHVLGLQNFHQPIVSIAGTVGWFTCTLLYRNISGVDRGAGGADAAHAPSVSALRRCLRWWPFPMLAKVFILLAPSTAFQLPLVLLESAAHEFGKALTFLPVARVAANPWRIVEWRTGLSIRDAEFRSGSAEIPLILSIKNSQTETTMYVRNIPMSAVLDRGGLEQRWVAVYPPGDPLNLHFDPNQLPRDGSPQVCLSVAVHEDLLATVANLPTQSDSSAFSSFPRFSPEARLSEGVDQLRRSISSLQAEMKLSQEREIERPSAGALGVAFARESLLPVAGGSHPGSRGPGSELVSADLAPWPSIAPAKNKVELDSWLKDIFDDKVMAEKLPGAVCGRFKECLVSPRPDGTDVGASQDTLLDLDFSSKFTTKPMKACLPADRLFQGETDGSSFPNGGLRVTHSAAAFTTWDRSSPPFVLNKTLYIPCAFVTHFGKCIDEKTPLLRSMDAVKREGLRLLKATGLGKDAKTIYSRLARYLGWEQEFFVIKAEHYKARPDLVNTGRTLFGKLPTRHQQGDLNYFAPVPGTVQLLLDRVQGVMLKIGCPMAVKHNEVAPGQHEMSPVFRVANVSCDSNVLFMEVMNREAQRLGLQVLFHEKPFSGINGSGKHANWSVGTDTGLNFFYPGDLLGYKAEKKKQATGCSQADPIEANVEDRNRTAPFPFCGNRFEFRAVGSSQNCNLPVMVCNAIMASGMSYLADLMEKGLSHRDAVAQLFKENRHVVFTGNGYAAEWRQEAAKRGLPNLTLGEGGKWGGALHGWRGLMSRVSLGRRKPVRRGRFQDQSRLWVLVLQLLGEWDLQDLKVMKMYSSKAEVLVAAPEATKKGGWAPCGTAPESKNGNQEPKKTSGTRDSAGHAETGNRADAPHRQEATFLCDVVKPQMERLRLAVDTAEGVMDAELYPYPSYETMLYSHHFEPMPRRK